MTVDQTNKLFLILGTILVERGNGEKGTWTIFEKEEEKGEEGKEGEEREKGKERRQEEKEEVTAAVHPDYSHWFQVIFVSSYVHRMKTICVIFISKLK